MIRIASSAGNFYVVETGGGIRVYDTFCANGGSLSRKDYLDRLARNGLYGIVHFGEDCKEMLGHYVQGVGVPGAFELPG